MALRAAGALFLATGAAFAQDGLAVPSRSETARLVWTTLIAVDQANRTGNYSVLRDLGAPDFQKANDPAQLAAVFAGTRNQDLGLDRVVLATPVYAEPPRILDDGRYYVTGGFPARPQGVRFELLFQAVEGEWRLFGISLGALPDEAEPFGEGAEPASQADDG